MTDRIPCICTRRIGYCDFDGAACRHTAAPKARGYDDPASYGHGYTAGYVDGRSEAERPEPVPMTEYERASLRLRALEAADASLRGWAALGAEVTEAKSTETEVKLWLAFALKPEAGR